MAFASRPLIAAAILLSFLGLVFSQPLEEPPPKYVAFDVKHNPRVRANRRRLRSRDNSVNVPVTSELTFYVPLLIGTPPQELNVFLDTGSSDLWVSSSNNPYCASNSADIANGYVNCTGSVFNQNKSSTFQSNGTEFNISYADTTSAQGVWGTDVINIGGTTIENSSVGVADTADTTSVFGIGLPIGEVTNNYGYDGTDIVYSNVPQLLRQQGHIDRVAYSLWLNNLDPGEGQLLFGAVDHTKYEGTLHTIPMVVDVDGDSKPIDFSALLTGMSITDSDGVVLPVMTGFVPALFDSGTSDNYLPPAVVNAIQAALNATFNDDLEQYIVPCSLGDGDSSFVYNFSGVNITSSLAQNMSPAFDDNNDPLTDDNGNALCALFLQATDDSDELVIMGDPFLRTTYVVFDLDNYELSIANTKFNVSSNDIQPIQSTVPSAVKAPNYSSTKTQTDVTVHTATGLFREGTIIPSKLFLSPQSCNTNASSFYFHR